MCKNNRGSVWMKILTFFPLDYHLNNIKNMFPLSIGLKIFNHDIIERALIKELITLKSGK